MPRGEASAAVTTDRFFQFSILGLLVSGYLAVAGSGYLDIPTVVLTGAGFLLQGLLLAGIVRFEISPRAMTLAVVGYAAFFGIDFFLISRGFLPAAVHLVFFLAVMRGLTARTNQDYFYAAAVGFLEILAAAILSININFFLFLALFVLFAAAALTSAEIRRSLARSPFVSRGGLIRFQPRLALFAASAALGILALTGGMFFMLPRTADAAFSRLISHRFYVPGFSNEVTLGEIGELKTSSRPVMHIRIFSREVPGGLKWRGSALTAFDGKRWSNPDSSVQRILVEDGHAVLENAVTEHRPGRRINYHVDLGAMDTDALFFAGTPEKLEIHSRELIRTSVDSFRLGYKPISGFYYDSYSLLEDPPEMAGLSGPPPRLPAAIRARNLQLPALDARIPALAKTFAAPAATDLERARGVERRLRSDYAYSLELPKREISDPLAYFLFTRREGYCEYFASAMAVMLRTLGIPARLATGFQSGIYNPVTDLWVVRTSDAHTWVEAWIPGNGWTTFDPTPPDPNVHGLGLAATLGLYLDAAGTFWQEWVVGYDAGRQGALGDRMEQSARRWGIRWFDWLNGIKSGRVTVAGDFLRRFGSGILAVLALCGGIWAFGPALARRARMRQRVRLVRRGQAAQGDATVLYQRMLHLLKQRGYQKPAWFTPAEFAASLPRPGLGKIIGEFTMTYNAWRFGGRTEVAPRLSLLLEELEREPH